MKQMNDIYYELDIRPSKKGLLRMVAFACAILLSSAVVAAEPTTKDNDSIVMAIYGFLGTKYASNTASTEEDYITDLGRSVYGKHSSPGYTDEYVNVDSLIKSIEATYRHN